MGKITILNETTKNPLTLMGKMAGVCYKSDVTDDIKNYKRGINCMRSGHHRVAEFPHVWMIIDGYSARVMREYMRHVGDNLSCLQASTRYIDYANEGFDYVIPNKIEKNWIAKDIYDDGMKKIKGIAFTLKDMGIDKEDVANLLPLGMTTTIVDCKNLRVLMDMSHTRMCTTTYWEFRELFKDICNALSEYSDEWKEIIDEYFIPKCQINGFCNEGKRSCGRRPLENEYREWYNTFLESRKNK